MKKLVCYGLIAATLIILSIAVSGCGGSAQNKIQPNPGPNSQHQLKDYENCMMCHTTGAGGAPKMLSNHSSYKIEDCQICHQFKQ